MSARAPVGGKNRYECFAHYEASLIRRKARQLVRSAGVSPGDEDDVQQDLALDLWRRKKKYDPAKAGPSTFANRVVNNRVSTILGARRAGCRDHRLEEGLADEGGDDFDLSTPAITQNEAVLATDALNEHVALSGDVRAVAATLTPDEQSLCARLAVASITDVAKDLTTARTTLYGSIAQLRRQFERARLRSYVSDVFRACPVGTGRRKP